ncbi:MAG: DUF2950 domain-containing protein [Myxococcota bacterium]
MRGIPLNQLTKSAIFSLLAAVLTILTSCQTPAPKTDEAHAFANPEAAGDALVAALTTDDKQVLAGILGKGSKALLNSGDPVDDQSQREAFVAAYELEHKWTSSGTAEQILEIGNNGWPFPIPLVEHKDGWRFDAEQGADEILNRRIGRNELDTIQACLAFVDSEREYYQRSPQWLATPQYARFIVSREGERDGLYWKTSADEAPSPLGPAYAAAKSAGYSPVQGGGKPFHGYLYRVLDSQGASAPGGAYDYIQGDKMTRGFALVAWPAKYGASGIMTFVVNHSGVVYQTDLGPDTKKVVSTLTVFNPDDSWDVVSAKARALPGT